MIECFVSCLSGYGEGTFTIWVGRGVDSYWIWTGAGDVSGFASNFISGFLISIFFGSILGSGSFISCLLDLLETESLQLFNQLSIGTFSGFQSVSSSFDFSSDGLSQRVSGLQLELIFQLFSWVIERAWVIFDLQDTRLFLFQLFSLQEIELFGVRISNFDLWGVTGLRDSWTTDRLLFWNQDQIVSGFHVTEFSRPQILLSDSISRLFKSPDRSNYLR